MGTWLDFRQLKERVGIESVLDRYGVHLKRVNQNTIRGKCPLPAHQNEKDDNSFSANSEKNLWTCHSDSCKASRGKLDGNIYGLVMGMEGLSTVRAAAERIAEWFPETKNPSSNGIGSISGTSRTDIGPDHNSVPLAPPINKPLGFQLKDLNPQHSMIQARGISVETAAKWGVGFFPGKGSMAGRIVFPLHERGCLIGYCGRAVGPETPKWKMPPGIVKTFLYGLERATPDRPLIVSESCWAVLFLAERGLQAASLLGSELTDGQESALAPFPVIQLALDNDPKGREATETIAERLRIRHKIIRTYIRE